MFEVLTDDNADGPLTARAYVKANKVAAKATYSTSSESDTGVYASDYSETCVAEDGLTWHVQVSYSRISRQSDHTGPRGVVVLRPIPATD